MSHAARICDSPAMDGCFHSTRAGRMGRGVDPNPSDQAHFGLFDLTRRLSNPRCGSRRPPTAAPYG